MAKYVFLAFTNPTKGREAEYNKWYDEHIPQVLQHAPGFVSGQRFRLANQQYGGETTKPWRYLAIYEIETNDLGKTLKTLEERLGTPVMPLSDALDVSNIGFYVLEPISRRFAK